MENTLPGKNHIKEDLKMVSSELNSTKGASISTSDNKNEKLTALGLFFHTIEPLVFFYFYFA